MSSEDIYVLKKLFTEYVSLYRMELNSGKYEILRLVENTNAKQLVGEEHTIFVDYDEFTRWYADAFVPETEQEEFLDWHKWENLKKRLREKESLTYYHSISKDGNLPHVLCAIRSISDVKKKEQELLHQVAEARKDAALKSGFLSNMSHDIRTPLNGIIGMTKIADCYPENPDIAKTGCGQDTNYSHECKCVCRRYH